MKTMIGSNRAFSPTSAQAAGSLRLKPEVKKLNDSIFELHKPQGAPTLEFVFFHGLSVGNSTDQDSYMWTWESEDGTCIWPQTWLVDEFPGARILFVSYRGKVGKGCSEPNDMYIVGENLAFDMIEANVGQTPNCPVVLVGHCFGGLVLKQLCLQVHKKKGLTTDEGERTKLEMFLDNIKRIFYYGTLHYVNSMIDKVRNVSKDPLLSYFETLSKQRVRLNDDFNKLSRVHAAWRTQTLGESLPSKSGLFKGVVAASEASARHGDFNCLPVDHTSICKPESKIDMRFYALTNLVKSIERNIEVIFLVHLDSTKVCFHITPYVVSLNSCKIRSFKRTQEYYIDLDGRVKQVCSLLAQTDTDTVFIVGLSGVGKTTLARQVFDSICRNFDATCFVSLNSIEGHSNGSDQVWRKIQDAVEGIQIDRTRDPSNLPSQLKIRKVLIVLDNVESHAQLDVLQCKDWLERSSSKLIVTSTSSYPPSKTSKTIEVGYLSSEESQQLFHHYAFQDGDGPHDLSDLILQVISKCAGYPLFVKILARFVSCTKPESALDDREIWLDLLKKLEKAEDVGGSPDYRLWAKLNVCFDSLLPPEQEIFLDIAFVFHGFPLSFAKRIWTASRSEPTLALLNLKSRFLFSVTDGGFIQMHAQLRNLGHSIACPRSTTAEKWKRIGGYSLTKDPELREMLVSKAKGPMETRGLELKVMESDSFTLRNFSFRNYHRLEYLLLERGRFTGWGKMELPPSLVYLRWKDGSFTDCPVDFTRLVNLVVLELVDCKSMKSLPSSIVKASKLTWLELEGCSSLSKLRLGLPVELQYLGLEKTGLKQLPDDSVNFEKLVELKASHTKLTQVPQRLGGLTKLSRLDLSNTGVTTLPDSVCLLRSLEVLHLGGTPLTSLPKSIGELDELRQLILDSTMLVSLPESIGSLEQLEFLTLANSKLHSLPATIGGLKKLTTLYLDSTCVTSLPQSIGNLVKLDRLQLQDSLLKELPDSVGNLNRLKYLQLENTRLSTLPETIGEPKVLANLLLGRTPLQSVPQTLSNLPLSLMTIDIGALFKSLKLKEPRSQTADSALAGLVIHSILPRDPHTLESLKLSGRGFPQSWVEPLFIALQKMVSLAELHMEDFNLVETIPCELGNVTRLRMLTITGCTQILDLPESLGKLNELQNLTLKNNPSFRRLPESLSALSSLGRLMVRDCESLQIMPRSFRYVSTSEREASTSEGDECNLESPPLQWNAVWSDCWSLVECFLECCGGKHFAQLVFYFANCKDIEEASKMARSKSNKSLEQWGSVIESKKAVEFFDKLNNSGLRRSPLSKFHRPSLRPGQRQTFYIRCRSHGSGHTFTPMEVRDSVKEMY